MIQTMRLFRFTAEGDIKLEDEKKFPYRSETQAKLVADEFSERHETFSEEGFIVVYDDDDKIVHKFELLTKSSVKR